MSKSINVLIIIFFLFFSMFAPKVSAVNIGLTICEYVASDDKKRLRSFLKQNKLKIRRIFKEIQCNGKNLLEFSVSKASVQTGTMMISKLPKKVVSSNLDIIKTGPQALIDAANNRLGG